jgi:nucleotide-binding universal stress UspA family protein
MMRRLPVVWPADLSGGTRTALAHAVALAEFLHSPLHLLYVPHGGDRATPHAGDAFVHPVIADVIHSAVRDLLPVSSRRIHARIVAQRGASRDAVIAYARRVHAGLIVLDTEYGASRGLPRRALATSLGKAAPCPVLVVAGGGAVTTVSAIPFREVLCAIESSSGSRQAVRAALGLTRGSGGRMTLLHVLPKILTLREYKEEGAAESARLRRLAPARAASGPRVRPMVVSGLPHRRILQAASDADADLIVMAKSMRGGLEEALLGSTTRAVLRRAKCPVLLVPMPEAPDAGKRKARAARTRPSIA